MHCHNKESRKAIITDIHRSSLHDGPGIRTTVFFKGCPLQCLWCHNPEAQAHSPELFCYFDKCIHCGSCVRVCKNKVHQFTNGAHSIHFHLCTLCGNCVKECNSGCLKIEGIEMSVDDIMTEVITDIDFYANSNGGITLSGGEPLLDVCFVIELLERCRDEGINRCVETSGFLPSDQFMQVLPLIDTLLFDYKITGSVIHQQYTGVTDELILANLDAAYHFGVPVILRCPIIPGINDTDEHFKGIRRLDEKYPHLKGIELLPYHSMGNSKRTSIGIKPTLSDLKSATPNLSEKWLEQLRQLKCEKVKIG